MFLQHSMLSRSESTLQNSSCGFRSVHPNLARHASLVQIRFHKACSLARPLPNVSLLRKNPTCFLESSNQACVASCNPRPGVLIVFLYCLCHTLIWIVEQCSRCVCFHTVPHSSFEVRRCVQHTLRSDVNEFLPCSWKYVLLMF